MSNRGVTLLEALISLVILAAIAGFIASAFRLASASIERGEGQVRETARLRAALELMSRTIRSADPAPLPADGKQRIYFVGEPDRIRLLSASPPSALAGGGCRLVSFLEDGGASGGGIAVSDASPFRVGGAEGWEGTEGSRILLRGARELAFSYSPGPAGDGSFEWSGYWNPEETGRLPGAVRIEFAATGENGVREKTSFVIPIPAGGAS